MKRHCSCLGFRVPVSGLWVPVFCNASRFFVMRQHITQHVWGRGGHIMKEVAHYKKLVSVSRKLVTETPNKNNSIFS